MAFVLGRESFVESSLETYFHLELFDGVAIEVMVLNANKANGAKDIKNRVFAQFATFAFRKITSGRTYCFLHKYVNFERSKHGQITTIGFRFLRRTL